MNQAIANYLSHCQPILVDYITEKIVPQYAQFDKAHQEDHAWQVINNSLIYF